MPVLGMDFGLSRSIVRISADSLMTRNVYDFSGGAKSSSEESSSLEVPRRARTPCHASIAVTEACRTTAPLTLRATHRMPTTKRS